MKTLRLSSIIAIGVLVVGSVSAADTDLRPPAGALQVHVNMPPSWRPLFEENATDAFVAQVDDVFSRNGFKGKIDEVDAIDAPAPGCALLTINLTEWRVDPIGNIDCTFTASVQTANTTKSLGVFTSSAFRMMSGPGQFGLADAFEQAAQGALNDLYRSIGKTQLVPGIRMR